jgi:DNA repair exonuclease SbcCD nuclease subunit
MYNILVYSDIHIRTTDIEECNKVFDEIVMLCEKYEVTQVVSLGDNFDNNRPNAIELNCMARFIKKLNRPIILIAAQSHESETSLLSSVDVFGILADNVKIYKEYTDESYLYCGHFTLTESSISYGATKTAEDYKKYKYVLLGHQHSLQAIGKNIMHLGACRYIDFAESQDKAKVVLLIENYKGTDETNHILGLKSPFPMKDVYLDPKGEKVPPQAAVAKSEEEFKAILDKLAPKTKVRVIFKDFDTYSKVINSLSIYKDKFILFTEKKDFIISDTTLITAKNEMSIRESLIKYLEDNKVNEDIKKILLEEIR